jgi:hypothetical protein
LVAYPVGKGKNWTIPQVVTTIAESAFSGCGFTSIVIPKNVSFIGGNAFYLNPIINVTLPANVVLGEHAISASKLINNDFVDYYSNNGQKAGAYTYSNGKWYYNK